MTVFDCCPVCGYRPKRPDGYRPEHGVSFTAGTGEVRHANRICVVHRIQLDLLEEMLDAYPQPVPAETLYRAAYKKDMDGPGKAHQLRAQISLLRHALRRAGMGFTVTTHALAGRNERHAYAVYVYGTSA